MPVNLLGVLLDVQLNEIDSWIGARGMELLGSNPLIGGILLCMIFLIIGIKVGVGAEAMVIFGGILIILLTASVASAGIAVGGLLPYGLALAFAVFAGFVIYAAFENDLR